MGLSEEGALDGHISTRLAIYKRRSKSKISLNNDHARKWWYCWWSDICKYVRWRRTDVAIGIPLSIPTPMEDRREVTYVMYYFWLRIIWTINEYTNSVLSNIFTLLCLLLCLLGAGIIDECWRTSNRFLIWCILFTLVIRVGTSMGVVKNYRCWINWWVFPLRSITCMFCWVNFRYMVYYLLFSF